MLMLLSIHKATGTLRERLQILFIISYAKRDILRIRSTPESGQKKWSNKYLLEVPTGVNGA